MSTITESLSQSIYKIPQEIRERSVDFTVKEPVILTGICAMMFVTEKLEQPSLIHYFCSERTQSFAEEMADIRGSFSVDIERDSEERQISCGIDTIIFMNFACEYSLENYDQLLENLGGNIFEVKDKFKEFLNYAAVKTTALLAQALTATSMVH